MLRSLWQKFDRDWGWNLSRLLAFTCVQMLFAAVGLDLILCSLALHIMAPTAEQGFVMQMVRLLPDRITVSAVSAFERSLRHAPLWLLVLGLPVTLWYGTRFFVVLESVLAVIFRRRQRGFAQQNGMALAMFPLVALLLPVIVLSAAVLPHLATPVASAAPTAPASSFAPTTPQLDELTHLGQNPTVALLGFGAGLVADLVVVLLSYIFVTPGRLDVRFAWPGALTAALLAQIYLLIFPFYVDDILHPDQFGSIAGFALVILVFFFAYAFFIVAGAEIASLRAGYAPAAHDVTRTLADAHSAAPPSAPRNITRPLVRPQPQPIERAAPDLDIA